LVADRLVQWQNDHLLAQAGDKNRRPVFVVSNLHSQDCSGEQVVHFCFESTCVSFNVPKRPRDPASRIENGGGIAFMGDCRLPREQQWIAMFHPLQKPTFANTFRAPFKR
jgi:hypothetical protein